MHTSAQCLHMADNTNHASFRFITNWLWSSDSPLWVVLSGSGPLWRPVGSYTGTPLFQRQFLVCFFSIYVFLSCREAPGGILCILRTSLCSLLQSECPYIFLRHGSRFCTMLMFLLGCWFPEMTHKCFYFCKLYSVSLCISVFNFVFLLQPVLAKSLEKEVFTLCGTKSWTDR